MVDTTAAQIFRDFVIDAVPSSGAKKPVKADIRAWGTALEAADVFTGQFPSPATRTALAKMQERADLRDWNGLDLTGANDNATLVQAAVTATAAAGVKLNVPAGDIVLGSTITVPQGSNIEGTGQAATGYAGSLALAKTFNTFFHLTHLGVGFNLIGVNDGPRRVAGIATYRDQAADAPGWVPLAAGADIQCQGTYDVVLEDLFLYNPTVAINVTGNLAGSGAGNGRITMRGLRGQPLSWGIAVTHVYDWIKIDDVVWWPFWSISGTNVTTYTKNNAKSLLFRRVDWPIIGSVSSIRMQDGLYIGSQASVGLDGVLPPGTTQHLHADVISVDNCQRGLTIAAGADLASVSIDRLTCTNTVFEALSMVNLNANNASVTIADLYGANTDGSLVSITGTGNNIKIGSSRSSGIDHDANGTPEFSVATGLNFLELASKPITSAGTVYAFGGTGRIRTPDWINITPTITASTGTITTVATIAAGDCKYKLEGTTCTFDYTITITTNGTGAGVFQATLPFAAKKIGGTVTGKTATLGLVGFVQSAAARADITKYDGTYPGADAAVLRFSGSYEIA